jgi:hypothetical protein
LPVGAKQAQFGEPPEILRRFPEKRVEFDDKVVRMNKFDKKSSQIGKEFVLLQP